MRQIVLDTETTGLDPKLGNRIIEIGCIELVNRRLTGRTLHFYINPERDSEEGALRVHGLTTEFLSDKPKFPEIAEAVRGFVNDAEIIIHNAPFDLAFLDAEFARLSWPRRPAARWARTSWRSCWSRASIIRSSACWRRRETIASPCTVRRWAH